MPRTNPSHRRAHRGHASSSRRKAGDEAGGGARRGHKRHTGWARRASVGARTNEASAHTHPRHTYCRWEECMPPLQDNLRTCQAHKRRSRRTAGTARRNKTVQEARIHTSAELRTKVPDCREQALDRLARVRKKVHGHTKVRDHNPRVDEEHYAAHDVARHILQVYVFQISIPRKQW